MLKIEVLTSAGWLNTGFEYDDTVVAIVHAHDLLQTTLGADYRVVNQIGFCIYTTEIA